MRIFVRSIVTCAIVTVALTSTRVHAASVSGALLNPPFPSSIAYPGFPDYTQANLTTLGTLDWIRVGESGTAGIISSTGYNQKSGGAAISGYSQTGLVTADSGSRHFLSYTNGTSPVSSTDQSIEIHTSGGFSFNVAASSSETRQLDIFEEIYGSATGHLVAQLYNSSNQAIGAAYTNDSTSPGTLLPGVYQIDFTGNSAGDYLAISFTQTAGSASGDYIALSAATLSTLPAATTPAPNAAVGGVVLLAGAWAIRRIKRPVQN
jgi:hypothetical protein